MLRIGSYSCVGQAYRGTHRGRRGGGAPASVVKELTENAIDAGATAVSVSVERGGIAMIQIADNGCGIEAEYIPTAFIRHATSKIEKEEDLESIHTLGFRGEALASVASVSRIEASHKDRCGRVCISVPHQRGRRTGHRAGRTSCRNNDHCAGPVLQHARTYEVFEKGYQ